MNKFSTKTILLTFLTILYLLASIFMTTFIYKHYHNQAVQNAKQLSDVILNKNLAIHKYINTQLKPAVFELEIEDILADGYFDPKWMSSTFVVREIQKLTGDEYFDYYYKEAAINARSPENEANDYEKEYLIQLNKGVVADKQQEIKMIDGAPFLVTLHKGESMSEGCLLCHSTPDKSPVGLVNYYGESRSFGRFSGEIVSTLSIKIPMEHLFKDVDVLAKKIALIGLVILFVGFMFFYFLINYLVFNPLSKLQNSFASDIKSSDLNRGLSTIDATIAKSSDISELMMVHNRLVEHLEKNKNLEKQFFIQKKFADMGQMLNAIAHQWRQPLNNIHLIMQAIMMKFDNKQVKGEEIRTLEKQHEELVYFMSQTIDDFRNYFKVEKNKKSFNLSKSVFETAKLMKAVLDKHSIPLLINCKCMENKVNADLSSLDSFCDKDISNLYGYEGEFKQIIINLLSNAKDAILESRNESNNNFGEIIIDIIVGQTNHTLIFKNTGSSIPEDCLSKIFDPYYTTKEEGKGTGIGLYMSRMMIEKNMSGNIEVKNTEDGVEFKIVIPIPTLNNSNN